MRVFRFRNGRKNQTRIGRRILGLELADALEITRVGYDSGELFELIELGKLLNSCGAHISKHPTPIVK